MPYERLELCVNIPGPKTIDEPLEQVEVFALGRLSPFVLESLKNCDMQRIIDYTGNYFLIFPEKAEEIKE